MDEEVVDTALDYVCREETRRRQIRAALAYPLMAFIAVLALLEIAGWTAARSSHLFGAMGQPIPFQMRILLVVSTSPVGLVLVATLALASLVAAYSLLRDEPSAQPAVTRARSFDAAVVVAGIVAAGIVATVFFPLWHLVESIKP